MQERNGRNFTPEQLEWLELIRDQVAVHLDVQPEDLWRALFIDRGGAVRAAAIFGEEDFQALLAEINEALYS